MAALVAFAANQALRRYLPDPPPRSRPDPDHTALLLSGGGNMTFFHLGVIKVLRSAELLPRVFSGASAGAMIAALVATRTDRELELLDEDEFKFIGFPERQPQQAYTAEMFKEELARVIPDVTFAEAEELSGRALNISLAGLLTGGIVCGPRSTPHVLVRDAIRASCAVPFVFAPVVVHERRRGRVTPFRSGQGWVDGSLFADVPGGFIKRRYGVRHTIVSLVNPAIRPFVGDPVGRAPGLMRSAVMGAARRAAIGFAQFGRFSAFQMPKTRDVFDHACRMMQQPYSGDLVLTPSRRVVLSEVLDHPSRDLIRRLTADGEARTSARLDDLRALAALGRPAPELAYQPAHAAA